MHRKKESTEQNGLLDKLNKCAHTPNSYSHVLHVRSEFSLGDQNYLVGEESSSSWYLYAQRASDPYQCQKSQVSLDQLDSKQNSSWKTLDGRKGIKVSCNYRVSEDVASPSLPRANASGGIGNELPALAPAELGKNQGWPRRGGREAGCCYPSEPITAVQADEHQCLPCVNPGIPSKRRAPDAPLPSLGISAATAARKAAAQPGCPQQAAASLFRSGCQHSVSPGGESPSAAPGSKLPPVSTAPTPSTWRGRRGSEEDSRYGWARVDGVRICSALGILPLLQVVVLGLCFWLRRLVLPPGAPSLLAGRSRLFGRAVAVAAAAEAARFASRGAPRAPARSCRLPAPGARSRFPEEHLSSQLCFPSPPPAPPRRLRFSQAPVPGHLDSARAQVERALLAAGLQKVPLRPPWAGYVHVHVKMDLVYGLVWLLTVLLEGISGQGVYDIECNLLQHSHFAFAGAEE
ncbi:mCG65397 [Mus musculus]|nr:mCG65397 [Mus musculus]